MDAPSGMAISDSESGGNGEHQNGHRRRQQRDGATRVGEHKARKGQQTERQRKLKQRERSAAQAATSSSGLAAR